jgi:hypothetical protein
MTQSNTNIDNMTDAELLAAELARVADEPAPPLSKAERMEQATLDQYTNMAWSLSTKLGENLLRYELNPMGRRQTPLYILPVSLCPSQFGETSGGMQHPYFDVLFYGVIKRHFQWAGRGPAVLINNRSIYEHYRDRESFVAKFLYVMTHELAHTIEYAPLQLADPVHPVHITDLEKQLSKKYIAPSQATPQAPWHNHELSYIRIVVNMTWRATRSGLLDFPIHPEDVLTTENYGLSCTEKYAAAFAEEPERAAKLPLSMLDFFDMPEAATQLYEDDRNRWHASHPVNQSASTTE